MPVTEAGRTASWGDQGNGTYINPILAADYSDPDVIRVNDTYDFLRKTRWNTGR